MKFWLKLSWQHQHKVLAAVFRRGGWSQKSWEGISREGWAWWSVTSLSTNSNNNTLPTYLHLHYHDAPLACWSSRYIYGLELTLIHDKHRTPFSIFHLYYDILALAYKLISHFPVVWNMAAIKWNMISCSYSSLKCDTGWDIETQPLEARTLVWNFQQIDNIAFVKATRQGLLILMVFKI